MRIGQLMNFPASITLIPRVISASRFAGSAAIGAATAYALFQTLLIAIVSATLGDLSRHKVRFHPTSQTV